MVPRLPSLRFFRGVTTTNGLWPKLRPNGMAEPSSRLQRSTTKSSCALRTVGAFPSLTLHYRHRGLAGGPPLGGWRRTMYVRPLSLESMGSHSLVLQNSCASCPCCSGGSRHARATLRHWGVPLTRNPALVDPFCSTESSYDAPQTFPLPPERSCPKGDNVTSAHQISGGRPPLSSVFLIPTSRNQFSPDHPIEDRDSVELVWFVRNLGLGLD